MDLNDARRSLFTFQFAQEGCPQQAIIYTGSSAIKSTWLSLPTDVQKLRKPCLNDNIILL
jgi:hypothetical protein